MNMKKKFLLLLLLLFTCRSLYSQDPVQLKKWQDSFSVARDDTSRVNILRQIGTLYFGIKPDSAIYFTRQALTLAEKINWTKGIAQNCLNLGANMTSVSNYD